MQLIAVKSIEGPDLIRLGLPRLREIMKRSIDPKRLEEDWEGNNIAVTCPNPECQKVFIVSARMHPKGRLCPRCNQSQGVVSVAGGRKSGGSASVIWPAENIAPKKALKPEIVGKSGGVPVMAKCPLCRTTFYADSGVSDKEKSDKLDNLFRHHMKKKHISKDVN